MHEWRDRRHLEPDSGCPGLRSRGYKETGCRSNWLELQSEKRRHQVRCRAPLKPVRGRSRESKLATKPQAPREPPPASLFATWFDPPRIEFPKNDQLSQLQTERQSEESPAMFSRATAGDQELETRSCAELNFPLRESRREAQRLAQ